MITEKEILYDDFNMEIKKLRDRINTLEKNQSEERKKLTSDFSKHVDVIKPDSQNQIQNKSLIPVAVSYSLAAMFLVGGINAFAIVFTPLNSLMALSLLSVASVGLIAGFGTFYMKKRCEEIRALAVSELVRNEHTEISIAETREEFNDRIEKRTSQIWETNKFLQKEITRRRNAENNIKRYNDELLSNRKKLEGKNLELEQLNRDLKNSESELRDLNNSKDKFFSILAHDLKNPFASIIGLAEFLNNEMDSLNEEESKKIARSISHSSQRVHKLLENLLKWSMVQTGRIKFDPMVFNISSLIEETIELFISTAESKEILLETEFNHKTLVYADRNMIETAVRNLISNSLKFTHSGGKVLVRTIQQNQFIRVDVIDNGVGISENDFNKIFRIEEHTNIAGTGNEKGTGIGLVLSKEFVEKNGGKIWFSSEKGKGSEFNFTIPNADENEKALYDNFNLTEPAE